jgi:hypothetical protein
MKATSILGVGYAKFLMVPLMIVMLGLCVQGQSKEQKVFDPVPEALRARLLERLQSYVDYQRRKDYGQLFDLFSQTTLDKFFHGQSKADFVKAFQNGDAQGSSSRLIEFKLTHIEKIEGEDGREVFVIYGSARLCEGAEPIRKKRVAMEAELQNGDWYFSLIADVLID